MAEDEIQKRADDAVEQVFAHLAELWSDEWVVIMWPEWIESLPAVERLAMSLKTLRGFRDNPNLPRWKRELAGASVREIEDRLAELMPLVEAELRRRGR
jgi:hypothetical protein